MFSAGTRASADGGASIVFDIRDQQSQSVPCRIHLRDSLGRPVRPTGFPFWNDHFVCDGHAEIEVPSGDYRWEIERGPEFQRLSGTASVGEKEIARVDRELLRIIDLKSEGWFSADLHVHRPVSEIQALMRAEDLDLAPVIEWWNQPAPNALAIDHTEFQFDGHRIYMTGAGEDERQGGALLFIGLKKPLDLNVQSREFPSPMHYVRIARQQEAEVWIDIEKPFWWDVPAWIASGQMQSIGIANNHMNRSGMLESEAWGRPRDVDRLKSPRGNGFWTQEIYYHLLNCGIRIPPSAGSASGVLKNPVGYNRVYANLGTKSFTRKHWFQSLREGRCFVSNGPLLRVSADGQHSGATLKLGSQPTTVELSIELISNDPVSQIEVVQNGVVAKQISCIGAEDGSAPDSTKTNGERVGWEVKDQKFKVDFEIEQPGWFLVRAIADVEETFRFASTAPWYLESSYVEGSYVEGSTKYVSRSSAKFFLDWIDERIEQIQNGVADPAQLESVLRWHIEAREFWKQKWESANAK